MTTRLPKDAVIEGLAAGLASLEALLRDLDPAEWATPTACPGWDVRAQVAHVVGTESMLVGIDPPPTDDDLRARAHVRNDIGAFNEAWVAGLADEPPDALCDRLHALAERRLADLRAMDQAAWDAEGFTPAGLDTHGRFMRIRAFDTWMHEQDIRDAVGRPGHDAGPAVELALDEMATAMGFVVGKKAGAPPGTSVTFDLTGAAARQVHVLVGDRAAVVDALPGPATTTLRMPVVTFTRLGGGRVRPDDVADAVEVEGDEALGRRVLEHLGYTI